MKTHFFFQGAVLGDLELRLQIIQHFRFRGVHLKCDLGSLVPFFLSLSLCRVYALQMRK